MRKKRQIASPAEMLDSSPTDPAKADPTKVTPAEAAKLLSAEGRCKITKAMIDADIEAGAPLNPDGKTLNVIVYGSWLLREESGK